MGLGILKLLTKDQTSASRTFLGKREHIRVCTSTKVIRKSLGTVWVPLERCPILVCLIRSLWSILCVSGLIKWTRQGGNYFLKSLWWIRQCSVLLKLLFFTRSRITHKNWFTIFLLSKCRFSCDSGTNHSWEQISWKDNKTERQKVDSCHLCDSQGTEFFAG